MATKIRTSKSRKFVDVYVFLRDMIIIFYFYDIIFSSCVKNVRMMLPPCNFGGKVNRY